MKKYKIFSVVLLIVSFLFIGYGIYFSFVTPKSTMYKALSKELNTLEKNIKHPSNKIKISGNINLNIDYEKVFSSKIENYYDNNGLFLLDVIYKINNEEKNQTFYYNKEKTYIKDNSFFEKFKFNFQDFKALSMINREDLTNLSQGLSYIISNSVTNNSFKSKYEEITINKNNLTVEKITLSLSYKEMKIILDEMNNRLKNNNDMESLREFFLSKKYTDFYNNVLIGSNDSSKADLICLEYITYIYDNEIIKHEVNYGDRSISFARFLKVNNEYDYEINENYKESNTLNIIISKENSSLTNINIRTNLYLLKGVKQMIDNNSVISLNVFDLDNMVSKIGKINFVFTNQTDEIKNLDLNAEMNINNKRYDLSGKMLIEKYDVFPKVDIE